MGNVLPSDLRLHRKYDLKGSRYGRTAGAAQRAANPYCTLKDLDVDMQLVLPAAAFRAGGHGTSCVLSSASAFGLRR